MAQGVASLTPEQGLAISKAERVASVFSLLGLTFIMVTFIFGDQGFRKPINRLMMYAAVGDAIYNIATLIARAGVEAGVHSAMCQFQGFTIQMFLLSDTMWNLSMAINVYLTVFRKYDAQQLKSLEWVYVVVNYGIPGIIATVLACVHTQARGHVYGNALLWCWISIEWDFLRIVCLYGPAWVLIVAIVITYAYAGIEIHRKHRALRDFSSSNQSHRRSQAPDVSMKTTEVQVTTELADLSSPVPEEIRASRRDNGTGGHNSPSYSRYNVTIGRGDVPETAITPQKSSHRQANAAWKYTKCAMLFFIALLITWLPSTINRVYSLVNPEVANWGLNLAAAVVLPLMGFWNTCIYIFTSWGSVKMLFTRDVPEPVHSRAFTFDRASASRPWYRIDKGKNRSGDASSEEDLTFSTVKRSPPDSLLDSRH